MAGQPDTLVRPLTYGTAAFAVVAPLQLRVMAKAGDAPDVASAANISAFTLGSALGIWLGGAAIDGRLGVTSVKLGGRHDRRRGPDAGADLAVTGPAGGGHRRRGRRESPGTPPLKDTRRRRPEVPAGRRRFMCVRRVSGPARLPRTSASHGRGSLRPPPLWRRPHWTHRAGMSGPLPRAVRGAPLAPPVGAQALSPAPAQPSLPTVPGRTGRAA